MIAAVSWFFVQRQGDMQERENGRAGNRVSPECAPSAVLCDCALVTWKSMIIVSVRDMLLMSQDPAHKVTHLTLG
jgi:hypothetical protein